MRIDGLVIEDGRTVGASAPVRRPAARASRPVGATTDAIKARIVAADARRRLVRRSKARYIGFSSRHGDESDVAKRQLVGGRIRAGE